MAAPSAQARVTLQNAFERFASTVAPDDKRLFHNTELKDVRDEVMRIERQLRARRMQRNMARLDPFLRGMEHYSKVVEVLCNGTPYLSWIWAPVKLMLMITMDSIGAFEKLIEAYAKIGDMLPRLDRLGHALADDHNFQNVLALVYSDVIEFHRRAYKFVRKQSWAIFFGSMWLGFESRFDGILKSLAYHSELADKEAAAADIAEAVRRSKADDEKWEQQENEWNAVKVQKVLVWLGTSDVVPAELLERHLRNCLPGSCDWFTKHKATQLWLADNTRNPFLWLCGKPGAGKSMISSALVQHAETNGVHVFYYFCSFLASHSDGPSRLLRAITSQVIQKHQDLAIYVHDVYFKLHPVPTEKTLLGLLSELFRGLGSVRLIIDGLDEWDPRYQKGLLKDLSQVISTDQNSHFCKIMIASRDTMDISRSFRKKNKSAMTVSLSDGDEDLAVTRSIANFVEDKLSDLPDHFDELDPDASIMAHVKKILLEKSHGMFLWVSLVLESLDTVYSPEELRTIVDDLPSDLEALYEQIMIRLCSASGTQSQMIVSRAMSWICFARRPLHKSELLQALSISPYDISAQERSIPVSSILDHCKPFVEELPNSTIVPVHFSVKEYFLKSRIPQIIPAIDAVLDMSSTCVIAITRGLDLLRPESGSMDYLGRIASGKYRLVPYAMEFWIEHCSQYASRGGTLAPNRPLQHHMARLHEKHQDYLHTLGRARTHVEVQNNPCAIADGQLELFSSTPIYTLMADVLNLKRLAGDLDGDNSSDIEAFVLDKDRTLFSLLAHKYEGSVVYLLAQQEVAGIAPATLRAFQQSYATTAFRCRFPHCERLSLGFATVELRVEHETTHVQRLYCLTETCQYSRIGFARRSALNAHTRKHHSQSKTLLIPGKVRSTRDGLSASDINADTTSPPERPEKKEEIKPGPSSYWSVDELKFFYRNIKHFGTDFTAIASHMGTKTANMIEDQYLRLVESGKVGLEQSAKKANGRRERGEDVGPPPIPTPTPQRRLKIASVAPIVPTFPPDRKDESSEDELNSLVFSGTSARGEPSLRKLLH